MRLSGQPPRSGVQRTGSEATAIGHNRHYPLALLIVAVAATLVPASERQVMRTADPSGMVYTPTGQLSFFLSRLG
jgi:hypothetical protein